MKLLLSSLSEIDAVEEEELLLELLGVDVELVVPPLLHAAMRSAAAPAATAVSPALDTEYNVVPRLCSRDMHWHVRDQIQRTWSLIAGPFSGRS
ncbi:MAG TPA: hypothetical protein VG142_01105 [Trebonia sp.]|nr:hypothetical protein [Trebonia sp.]